MRINKKYNEELERLAGKRLAKRHAKKRKRMPVHGAGLKRIGKIWGKRYASKSPSKAVSKRHIRKH